MSLQCPISWSVGRARPPSRPQRAPSRRHRHHGGITAVPNSSESAQRAFCAYWKVVIFERAVRTAQPAVKTRQARFSNGLPSSFCTLIRCNIRNVYPELSELSCRIIIGSMHLKARTVQLHTRKRESHLCKIPRVEITSRVRASPPRP